MKAHELAERLLAGPDVIVVTGFPQITGYMQEIIEVDQTTYMPLSWEENAGQQQTAVLLVQSEETINEDG